MKKGRPTTRRPKPFSIDPYRARVVRGPREEDGKWYWQVRYHQGSVSAGAFSVWGTADEVRAEIVRRMAAGEDTLAHVYAARVPRHDGAAAETASAEGQARASEPEVRVETIRDLLEYWVGHQETRLTDLRIAARTFISYKSLAKFVVRHAGDLPVASFGQDDLANLATDLRRQVKVRTIVVSLKVLIAAFRWAAGLGLVDGGTLELPQLPRPGRDVKRVATPAEFWAAADATPMGWNKTFLMVLGLTGCRPQEAARLRWSDYNPEEGSLRIGPHEDVGNDGGKHPRTVFVPVELVEHLSAWRAVAAPTTEDATIMGVTPAVALRYWSDGIRWRKGGVEPLKAYDLRRMLVAQYVRANVDFATYEEQMGHSLKVAREHYLQNSREAATDAMRRAGVGARVDPTLDPKPDPKPGRGRPKK